jgi:hypothetical protein
MKGGEHAFFIQENTCTTYWNFYYYSSKQVIIYVCIYGTERNIITIYIYLLLANIIVVS